MLLLAASLLETSVPHQRSMTGGQSPGPGLLTPHLSPRYDEGSGGSGDEGRDEAHKREWNLFYQKQMSLRKVKGVGGLMGSQVALHSHSLSPCPGTGSTGGCSTAKQGAS